MNAGRTSAYAGLRVWPGVAAVTVQWLAWAVVPLVAPQYGLYGTLVGIGCGVVVLAWWLGFSRAPWAERVGALLLMVAGVAVVFRFVHPSISNGMMGMMLPFYAVPVLSLALVLWAVAADGLGAAARRAALAAAVATGSASFMLIRTDGITGEGNSDLHWRWTPTAEERLITAGATGAAGAAGVSGAGATGASGATGAAGAEPPSVAAGPVADVPDVPAAPVAPAAPAPDTPAAPVAPGAPDVTPAAPAPDIPAAPAALAAPVSEWAGFRGSARDSVVRGVRIGTDWSHQPPVELWRRPIGPGWSSFAVHGDVIYTQEQRGEEEVVSAYRLSTGDPVWRHADAVRFWESNGGAGPRATPTIHDGRVYTMGATGLLNALDAATGARLWSRRAAEELQRTVPDWGIASSPLAIGNLVVVAVAGRLAAYDAATGEPRWMGTEGGGGYSSPQLATIDDVPQVVLARGSRTTSVAPADGTVLWEHVAEPSVAIVQPAMLEGGGVLVAPADAMGGISIRRLAVTRGPGGWSVEERWASRGLKPYFNDFVVHRGHAFGFDGSILACIDLADGQRKWKGGRYGHGQMVLLPEQDLLLVLSEEGELALVSATPDRYTEIARVPALEGKTWNHPVLVGDVLLVRNGEEMAAFRLEAPAATHP